MSDINITVERLLYLRCAIPNELMYNRIKHDIGSVGTVCTIEGARKLVLAKANLVTGYWTKDRLSDFLGNLEAVDGYINPLTFLLESRRLRGAGEVLTLCLVQEAFRMIGVEVSPLLAYVIWEYFVSEAYSVEWLKCDNLYDCWQEVITHFLFVDWDI